MIKEINGDITKINTQYIAHQCNCISKHAYGLAKILFETFPWSDIYKERVSTDHSDFHPDCPGEISIHGNGQDQRYVINMLAQFWPGKPKQNEDILDGYKVREKYFKSCLKKIIQIENLESVAFPVNIGCGLAGGDWKQYKSFIEVFAKAKENTEVLLINKGNYINNDGK